MTEADLVDRVRDVCDVLGYTEAVGFDFTRTPVQAPDGSFMVAYASLTPKGYLGMNEEARGTVTVSILRAIGEQYQTARRTLLTDLRAVLSGVIEDGAVTSGEYAVEDTGRAMEIDAPRGAQCLIGRLRATVNFEAAL